MRTWIIMLLSAITLSACSFELDVETLIEEQLHEIVPIPEELIVLENTAAALGVMLPNGIDNLNVSVLTEQLNLTEEQQLRAEALRTGITGALIANLTTASAALDEEIKAVETAAQRSLLTVLDEHQLATYKKLRGCTAQESDSESGATPSC